MAGSDSSAEIKALLLMVAISLAMGGGVLLFKSDYRAVDIWRSNESYYPNVRLPGGDSLRVDIKAAAFRESGEVAPANEPTLAETLAAAAAEFRKTIGQPRPDLEGAEGEALYAQEFDGDRVLTREAESAGEPEPSAETEIFTQAGGL